MNDTAKPVRVALLTEIISPYRIPLLNELSSDQRVELEVIFFSETEERRKWRIPWEKIRFHNRVLPGLLIARRYQGGPVFFNPGIITALWSGKYQAVICFGYHHPTIWLALIWCWFSRARALLWSESTHRDSRSYNVLVDWLKRRLLRCFDGFVAAGKSQAAYLRDLGAPAEKIWVAPDAVDSDFFTTQSNIHHGRKHETKRSLGVEGCVILYVGRLLDAKGIPELLDAFEQVVFQQHATLFLVGDGPDRARYQQSCRERELNSVRFEGFCPQEDLPRYYGIADVFVFPTRSDPWGLVLNEAMCAGLPVICSTAAGAAADLVQPGRNGLLHEPGDVETIVEHLLKLLGNGGLRQRMGISSRKIILGFSPRKMAQGFAEAVLDLPNKAYTSVEAY